MEEEEEEGGGGRKGSLDSPLDFLDRFASMRSSMGDDGILTATIGESSNDGGGGAARTSEEKDEND